MLGRTLSNQVVPSADVIDSSVRNVFRARQGFWVTLGVLLFATAFIFLAAWHEVQTLFGV